MPAGPVCALGESASTHKQNRGGQEAACTGMFARRCDQAGPSFCGHYNDRVLALRYVYVLALALWLGGMVVLGAGGRALSSGGAAFGAILSRFHYVAYGAGTLALVSLAAMALSGPAARVRRPLAIVALMLLIALVLGLRRAA
jgi:hypothetical protein